MKIKTKSSDYKSVMAMEKEIRKKERKTKE